MKTTMPAIATMLFTAGAHVNGPNTPRALRISPNRLYSA
jgi:hypothetical protein